MWIWRFLYYLKSSVFPPKLSKLLGGLKLFFHSLCLRWRGGLYKKTFIERNMYSMSYVWFMLQMLKTVSCELFSLSAVDKLLLDGFSHPFKKCRWNIGNIKIITLQVYKGDMNRFRCQGDSWWTWRCYVLCCLLSAVYWICPYNSPIYEVTGMRSLLLPVTM